MEDMKRNENEMEYDLGMEPEASPREKKPRVRPRSVIAILLTLLFAFVGSAGLSGVAALMSTGAGFNEVAQEIPYMQTEVFRNAMFEAALEEFEADYAKDVLWVDGSYNPDETVDITCLPAGIRYGSKNDATTYRIGDLLSMYEQGVHLGLQDLLRDAEAGIYTKFSILQKLENEYGADTFYTDEQGNLYAATYHSDPGVLQAYLAGMPRGGSWQEILDDYGMVLFLMDGDVPGVCTELPEGSYDLMEISYDEFAAHYSLDLSMLTDIERDSFRYSDYSLVFQCLYSEGMLLEICQPVSGEPLAVYALRNPVEVSILDCYKQLVTAIETVGEAVQSQDYLNVKEAAGVSEEETGPLVYYWVGCDEWFWTNNPEWENPYFDITRDAETDYHYWSQDRIDEESYPWDDFGMSLRETYGMETYEYVVAMNPAMMDTQLQLDYGLRKGYYDNYIRYGNECVTMMVGGALASAVCFLLAALWIGKRDKTKNRYAGPFAVKMPIEGLLLLGLCCWIGFVLFGLIVADDVGSIDIFNLYGYDHAGNALTYGGQVCITLLGTGFVALLLWQVLTLVAKAKSRNMTTNSWIGRGMKTVVNDKTTGFGRRWPIELLLLLDVGCWFGYVALAIGLHDMFMSAPIASVVSFVAMVILFVLLAIWQAVTLSNKCKNGHFTTNSLLRRGGGAMIGGIKSLYNNRKVTGKLVWCCVIFVGLSLLFVGLAVVNYASGFFIFLLLVFWVFVFVVLMRKCMQRQRIKDGIREIAGGNMEYQIRMDKLSGDELDMAWDMNNIKEGIENAVERMMKSERMKTDLITNVSHDLRTPLTSIINYVDILKKEDIQDERIRGYIDILAQKSLRLKNLTEDLMEAAKISSGNITLDMQNINLKELLHQTNGEFEEKFARRNLSLVCTLPESDVYIKADGRRMWRVIENLYNNAAKYAQPYSRVYVDGKLTAGKVMLIIKNVSEAPLNISADELMERFVRGDVSRNTEGSGLGLEIARNLTVMQNGTFEIQLDGDLFKVILTFDAV